MVRKPASTVSDSVTISGAKLDTLRAVLCCAEFKGTFIPAGEILGLAQPKHASSLFRSVITPMGLELKDGKVYIVGGNDTNAKAAAANPSLKRKCAPVGALKGGNPAKKVKTEVYGENEDASASKDDAEPEAGDKVDATEAAKIIKVEGSADA